VRNDLDLSAHVHRLDGVDEQIEQHLPEQLFVGLDGQRFAAVTTRSFFSSRSWFRVRRTSATAELRRDF